MGEVIKLRETEIEKFVEKLKGMVESGELESMYFAGCDSNGDVIIGSINTDYADRQRLIAELQIDVINMVI